MITSNFCVIGCKEICVDGVVFGFLTSAGDIDIDKTSKFVDMAKPLYTTFHRAFDMCRQPPLEALQDIAACNIDCLLSSGRSPSCANAESLQCLSMLVRAKSGVTIMAGGGSRKFLTKFSGTERDARRNFVIGHVFGANFDAESN